MIYLLFGECETEEAVGLSTFSVIKYLAYIIDPMHSLATKIVKMFLLRV